MTAASLEAARQWLADGEQLVETWVIGGDHDLAVPSLLPGWSRAHVVAHLANNAAALTNLVTWARTGVPTPMYRDLSTRAADVERLAGWPAEVLRHEAHQRSAALLRGYGALTGEQLQARVVTAQGKDRAVAEVAWMRARESYIHLTDLDIGFDLGQLPVKFIDALLTEAADTVGGRRTGTAIRLQASDRPGTWTLGAGEPHDVVTGTAADLLRWTIGRPPRPDDTVSARTGLPRWL